MWNWLVSVLAAGATLLLSDGSPFNPDGNIVFDFDQVERCTFVGTSAKFIDACHKAALKPKATNDLVPLRTLASTVFFFQAEDGIRDGRVTGVQTCALPI